jgi:FkbM family methyltransferase
VLAGDPRRSRPADNVPANSKLRRLVKKPLARFQWTAPYGLLQSLTMAWDIRTGAWTEPELDLIPYAVRPGESALDIGANFGLWSFHLASVVGRTGRVLAFEPVPFTYACLRRVSRLLHFHDVEAVPFGCGERTERMRFTAPSQGSGAIAAGLVHLSGRVADASTGRGRQPRQDVEIWCDVVALDDFLPEMDLLSFVKCDIEGGELFAFRGASRLIEENLPTVVCEIDESFLKGFGLRTDDIFTFFSRRAYLPYRYEQRPTPRLHRLLAGQRYPAGNYVFVHPSRAGRFAPLLA